MSVLHFKINYESKTLKFARNYDNALIHEIRKKASEMVGEAELDLYWEDGCCERRLDTIIHLLKAIDNALNFAKSSNAPPCVYVRVVKRVVTTRTAWSDRIKKVSSRLSSASRSPNLSKLLTESEANLKANKEQERRFLARTSPISRPHTIPVSRSRTMLNTLSKMIGAPSRSTASGLSPVTRLKTMTLYTPRARENSKLTLTPEVSPTSQRQTTPTSAAKAYEKMEPGYASRDISIAASTSVRYTPSPDGHYGSTDAEIETRVPLSAAKHRWLLLRNGGNDCFLNAALQFMRRAGDLRDSLENRPENGRYIESLPEDKQWKEAVLRCLTELLSQTGYVNPRQLREALPIVIPSLERHFLLTQQDAYEILTKIFDDLIPEDITKRFSIESSRRRRCRDNVSCKAAEHTDMGPIFYKHIEVQDQVVDLEALLSDEWTAVEGETEPRHCSACCKCCTAAEEGHNEDKCEDCKGDRKHYVEEQKFAFKGDSNYAFVAFNILHSNQRVDWELAHNCDLDRMKLMGNTWKAVALIRHIGSAWENWSAGHYVTYTREEDGLWYCHDDDQVPYEGIKVEKSAGETLELPGILAILFEKIH